MGKEVYIHRVETMDQKKLNDELLAAAAAGELKKVKELLTAEADVNARDRHGRTPMMRAVNSADAYSIVLYLLEQGGDSKARDDEGKTARDHLVMPEPPPEHHENGYEAWIHCEEHHLNTLLYRDEEGLD